MAKFLKNNKEGCAWLALAAVFILIGVMNGEAAIVLQKAVNICLECIGIG